jgi:transcriptional regulator with XRE-family HTH domain
MFPKRLRLLRTKLQITQAEVAKRLEITPTAYSNYENGEREPDIATLHRLCDIFDCSLDYLTGRVSKPYLALFEDLSEEFQQEGVAAIEITKSLVKEGLTAGQLNDLLMFVKSLNTIKKF